MKKKFLLSVGIALATTVCFSSPALALFGGDKSEAEKVEEAEEERADIRKTAGETLA
jgi:hypothetical protein